MSVVLLYGHLSKPGFLSNTGNFVISSILCASTELGAVSRPSKSN